MKDLLNDYFHEVKHFSEESEILKKFIISLAVQGKLINKKSNSDSAKNLLNEIKKEKEFLIKKGEKILLSSFDQKLLTPFKIPTNWEWSSLGEICMYIQRGKTPKYALEGPKVISQKCIQWSGLDLSVAKFIENESLEKYKKEQFLKEGDLLWNSTGTGTIGRVLKVNNLEEKLVCDSHVTILRCLKVNPDFVKIWLISDFVYGLIEEKASGSTNQIELTKKIAIEQCVPIPPLVEQNTIVEKVEELMRLCDQLEKDQNNCIETHNTLVSNLLSVLTSTQTDATKFAETWQIIQTNFDILFTTESSVEKLKKAILQIAIMGRLVPQNLAEGSAVEELKLIAEKKVLLIKGKKIKKKKLANPINPEDDPYSLPINWQWCKLEQIGIGSTGKTPKTIERDNFGGDIEFIGPGEITEAGKILNSQKTLTQKGLTKSVEALPRSILMVCIGGSIGKSAIVQKRIAFNQQINAIYPIDMQSKYINIVFSSDFFQRQIQAHATGSATPIINRAKWESLLIPIPPIAEQHRIIKKIDEFISLCDQLKTKIVSSKTIKINLTDSLVEKAIR